jgi:type III pantothenate kinase
MLGNFIDGPEPPSGVMLCNVAGEKLDKVLQDAVSSFQEKRQSQGLDQESLLLPIEYVHAQAEADGVRCAYEYPAQLGADRWAALVAARHQLEGASCIIDCGTAMTVDVLTADGRHAGGVIIPGMEMMISSLVENTEGVFAREQPNLSPLAVTNTMDAVQAGVIAAMHGTIQQVLQHCRDELGIEPICVLTGGNAQRLLPEMPSSTIFEPDWVLKGLATISARHRA